VDGWVAEVDATGLGGGLVVVPQERARALRDVVEAAGATAATEEAWLRLRVERLVPQFGADMDEHSNPHEASLDRRCVSWTKGCYLGQEAVCMQDMRGKVKRRLALLRLQAGSLPPPGTAVLSAEGIKVGETRSAASSATWDGALVLGLIAAGASVPGTRLSLDGKPAEVVTPDR